MGFLFLTAAINVYSRYVVACDRHNTLDAFHVLAVLKRGDNFYLHPISDGLQMYSGLNWFFDYYNRRAHQGIGRIPPIELYKKISIALDEKHPQPNCS